MPSEQGRQGADGARISRRGVCPTVEPFDECNRPLRSVLRSIPRLVDTSLIERPAYQWIKISVTLTMSNVLLAIGSLARPKTREDSSGSRGPHPGRARRPHGELRGRPGGELRERQTPTGGDFRERRRFNLTSILVCIHCNRSIRLAWSRAPASAPERGAGRHGRMTT
jgi:hypothetical protein